MMAGRLDRNGLQVDARLAAFVEGQALPGTGVEPAAFWAGMAAALRDLAPKNRALLARRDALQAQIDAWHRDHRGQTTDPAATPSTSAISAPITGLAQNRSRS